MLGVVRNFGLVRWFGLAVVLGLCVVLASGIGRAQETTYTNPVSKTSADTFADPSIIKAKNGYWYSYGTSDPLREGEGQSHTIPIARSDDMVDWEYVGDAFGSPSEVSWAAPDASLWAPDIRYFNGKYHLYYVVTQTKPPGGTDEPNDNAIGVATAPSPTGPWTDSGAPVVGPRPGNSGNPGDFKWTFDPSEFTDHNGNRYLYYGSYYGGIWVTRLSDDGTRAVGSPTMVAIDNRYEGAYVVRHGDYYHLFASSANCCVGPTTGYSVYAGRSTSPRGPFVDKQGQSMTASRVGGSIVITPNGNKWVGTGHNAIATDLSGQDYFVYHAIDRNDPYLDEPFGINERPMLLDRLDWIDGWPTVRGGKWASAAPQPAPVTDGPVNDSFNGGASLNEAWRSDGGNWTVVTTGGGGYVSEQSASDRNAYLIARASLPADVRVEADLRTAGGTAAGVAVRYKNADNYAVAWLDRSENALVTNAVVRGRSVGRQSTALPDDFPFGRWHNVAVEVRGSKMRVEVTDARLNDPYAVANRTLPGALSEGRAGVASRGGQIDADNVSAVALYTPHTRMVDQPRVGSLAARYSDEFNDGRLEAAWDWVRRHDPDGREISGVYRWPVQQADIVDDGNPPDDDASVLLRDAPKGAYTVQTKLTIDLGVNTIHNFQQGGLIAYENDDLWVRLSHVAIWNTRQTEFGKEMPFADRTSFGGMLVGPPAETTWLRLSHRIDPNNGEHEFQAATSRDGKHWVWGGTWTLPAGTNPRIGLISLGKQDPNDKSAISKFDYFRVYKP
jgi:arabinan endo-1,5-alpha-L-arabinosidase